jgi:hypothetical protein
MSNTASSSNAAGRHVTAYPAQANSSRSAPHNAVCCSVSLSLELAGLKDFLPDIGEHITESARSMDEFVLEAAIDFGT